MGFESWVEKKVYCQPNYLFLVDNTKKLCYTPSVPERSILYAKEEVFNPRHDVCGFICSSDHALRLGLDSYRSSIHFTDIRLHPFWAGNGAQLRC